MRYIYIALSVVFVLSPFYLDMRQRNAVTMAGLRKLSDLGVYNAKIDFSSKACKKVAGLEYKYTIPYSGITSDSVKVHGCLCSQQGEVFVYSIIDRK